MKHHIKIPRVLTAYIDARADGNADMAANCCSDGVIMRGPMGEFSGLESVKERAFSRKSQPISRELTKLEYQPQLSTPGAAVYAREFEATIGEKQVPLRQEFTVENPESYHAKVSLVVFSKLG